MQNMHQIYYPTKIGFFEMGVDMLQTLRKAGGSLVMTIPKAFIEQNGLKEGAQVELLLSGKTLTVAAKSRLKYKLEDLIAEMPDGLPIIEEWENMPSVGLEKI